MDDNTVNKDAGTPDVYAGQVEQTPPDSSVNKQADGQVVDADAGGAVMARGSKQPASIPGGQGGRGLITPIRDSARASELARRRWDKAENVARRVMREKAGGSDWAAGVGELVAAQYDLAVTGQRGSTPAAQFVLRTAGLLRDHSRMGAQDASGSSSLSFTATGPAGERIAAIIARALAGKLGQGEAGESGAE